jgi:hypothetical protein
MWKRWVVGLTVWAGSWGLGSLAAAESPATDRPDAGPPPAEDRSTEAATRAGAPAGEPAPPLAPQPPAPRPQSAGAPAGGGPNRAGDIHQVPPLPAAP